MVRTCRAPSSTKVLPSELRCVALSVRAASAASAASASKSRCAPAAPPAAPMPPTPAASPGCVACTPVVRLGRAARLRCGGELGVEVTGERELRSCEMRAVCETLSRQLTRARRSRGHPTVYCRVLACALSLARSTERVTQARQCAAVAGGPLGWDISRFFVERHFILIVIF